MRHWSHPPTKEEKDKIFIVPSSEAITLPSAEHRALTLLSGVDNVFILSTGLEIVFTILPDEDTFRFSKVTDFSHDGKKRCEHSPMNVPLRNRERSLPFK